MPETRAERLLSASVIARISSVSFSIIVLWLYVYCEYVFARIATRELLMMITIRTANTMINAYPMIDEY